jgi:hypothetical protein
MCSPVAVADAILGDLQCWVQVSCVLPSAYRAWHNNVVMLMFLVLSA